MIDQIKPFITVVKVENKGAVNAAPQECPLVIYGAGWNTGLNKYTVQEIQTVPYPDAFEFHEYWTPVDPSNPKIGEYLIIRVKCRHCVIVEITNTGSKRMVYRHMKSLDFPFWYTKKPTDKGWLLPTASKLFILCPDSQIILNYGPIDDPPKG